jgi:hypothetical protein
VSAGTYRREVLPFGPLRETVERRLRPGVTLRQLLMPEASPEEWQRSGVRRAYQRGNATGVLTLRAADQLCVRIGVSSSRLYPLSRPMCTCGHLLDSTLCDVEHARYPRRPR